MSAGGRERRGSWVAAGQMGRKGMLGRWGELGLSGRKGGVREVWGLRLSIFSEKELFQTF
jgi:hypothetical protein